MQSFLPYPSFTESAKVLDYRRLGKMRIETKQIYLALTDKSYGWQNHPAVLQWKGYEVCLLMYGIAICEEWIKRGYEDNQLNWFKERLSLLSKDTIKIPDWLNNPKFHVSHQSNLIRKDPSYYKDKFPGVTDDLPYFWPTKEGY